MKTPIKLLCPLLIVGLLWNMHTADSVAAGNQKDTLEIGGALRYNILVTDCGGESDHQRPPLYVRYLAT